MRKEKYTAPEMEIVEFEAEDVIVASSGYGDNNTQPDPITGFVNDSGF